MSTTYGDSRHRVESKTVQGIHMFRRDRRSQVVKCHLWSTRLCPYPYLVWKMRTYLELEGRLGPKSKTQPQSQLQPTQLHQVHMQWNQQRLAWPSTNPRVRKSPSPKVNDKRRKTIIAKRRYKVRYSPSLHLPPQHQLHPSPW